MSRLLRWLGIALALLLAAYFVHFAMRTLQQYDLGALMTPRLFLAIAMAALLYSLIIPISGWAWSVLLRGAAQSWSTPHLSAIMGTTQLAKYVPGNLGQHIGRMVLSLSKGMSPGNYLASVFIETWLAMCAGLVVGIAFALLSPVASSSVLLEYRALLSVVAIALILVALALPWILAMLPPLLRRIRPTQRWGDDPMASPGFVVLAKVFLAYSANYLLIGLGIWLVALAVEANITADYLYLTAVFALSWLAGFVTPGAPAGLGVREGAMALLLSGIGTSDAILVLIAAIRVATLLGDALCFVASLLYLRHTQSSITHGPAT